ncbi:GNAT family N-acetyltransferase [Microbacterium sp. ET2]|uniref:GNAT family N-acetyltransferase n=1 Tax=Microbacterium albipurpureum TaxID=3050384 RepID=UPI00259C6903|nr:GNAT family N-acetyltransferase [Microbacterium sp. ET2 (Ac-2212)]WJL96189.1 GNAT family N-acetyltransferase [Microbacterium sp. ET2 (Ac-2212)]
MTAVTLRPATVADPAVRRLIEFHLRDMQGLSPAESVHALGAGALDVASVELWGAWDVDALAGVGALAALDAVRGELKSMRVADAYRGRGVGRLILCHLIERARRLGMTSVWLETGSAQAFAPARGLYLSEGFRFCAPFGDYSPDPHSVFLTRNI